MTGDDYEDLAARGSALESAVRSLRARHADFRGEFAQVHDELAELRAGLAEVREAQRDHSAVLEAQSLRLDQHYEFHLAHAAGLAALSETVRANSDQLTEILRRLDAA